MKTSKYICLPLLLILLNFFAGTITKAQSKNAAIKGMIISTDGAAAGYVNVGLKPHGQVMEEMGRFMAEVAPEFNQELGSRPHRPNGETSWDHETQPRKSLPQSPTSR